MTTTGVVGARWRATVTPWGAVEPWNGSGVVDWFVAADDRWHKNAADISDFLSKANPNWPRATLLDMMNTHLSTTATELTARLTKDWDGDVKAFDAVYDHILHMADALSDGIVKQFPDKFGNEAVSTTGR